MYTPLGMGCILLLLSNLVLVPALVIYSIVAALQLGDEANLSVLWKRMARWAALSVLVCLTLIVAETFFEPKGNLHPNRYIRTYIKPGISQQQVNGLLLKYENIKIEPLKETDKNNRGAFYEQWVTIRHSILLQGRYIFYYDKSLNLTHYFIFYD